MEVSQVYKPTIGKLYRTGERLLAGSQKMCVTQRMIDPVYIVGASGRSGLALAKTLSARGTGIVPVVRDPSKWAATGMPQPAHVADLRAPDALRAALAGATAIVSCAHARHAPAIVAVPAWLPIAAAWIMHAVPFLPDVEPAEVRRLLEDKAFDIAPARAALGFDPIAFREGLARTFGNPHHREKA